MSLHSEHPTELEPGHAPAQNYEPIFATTRALILLLKKCADVYGRRPEDQQLSRSLDLVYELQRFIESPGTLHLTRQEYDAKLDAMHERIAVSFTENALLFETLCERRKQARDGICGCGGFTQSDRTMLRQQSVVRILPAQDRRLQRGVEGCLLAFPVHTLHPYNPITCSVLPPSSTSRL